MNCVLCFEPAYKTVGCSKCKKLLCGKCYNKKRKKETEKSSKIKIDRCPHCNKENTLKPCIFMDN